MKVPFNDIIFFLPRLASSSTLQKYFICILLFELFLHNFLGFKFCLKLVGVWFVNQWISSGQNTVQLVELGPGRGTLASDLLRVSLQFMLSNLFIQLSFIIHLLVV